MEKGGVRGSVRRSGQQSDGWGPSPFLCSLSWAVRRRRRTQERGRSLGTQAVPPRKGEKDTLLFLKYPPARSHLQAFACTVLSARNTLPPQAANSPLVLPPGSSVPEVYPDFLVTRSKLIIFSFELV